MQIMDTKIVHGGVVDISSFLLVEGTADSDADYGVRKICQDHINTTTYDKDDAESCSCEYTSDGNSDQEIFCSDEFNDGDNEGDERWKTWLRENANLTAIDDEAESKNGINISREVMDEMEDWLFWETCLAVGYP